MKRDCRNIYNFQFFSNSTPTHFKAILALLNFLILNKLPWYVYRIFGIFLLVWDRVQLFINEYSQPKKNSQTLFSGLLLTSYGSWLCGREVGVPRPLHHHCQDAMCHGYTVELYSRNQWQTVCMQKYFLIQHNSTSYARKGSI